MSSAAQIVERTGSQLGAACDEDNGVPDQLIAEVAKKIRSMQYRAGLQLARDIGHLVLDKFYGGDIKRLRQKRGLKDVSLRRLARHPDLPMSASALCQAISIFEVLERCGSVYTWKHIGPCHVRVVVPLPSGAQQTLLQRAEECRWTVRQLEEQARAVKRPKRRGRSRLPTFVKTIRSLRSCALGPPSAFGELERVHELNPQQVAELRTILAGLRKRCEELEQALS